MLKILIISVITAKILVFEQPLKLPDKKPFNCIPCLSFWLFIYFGSIKQLTEGITFFDNGFTFLAFGLCAYFVGTLLIKFKL